jgi:predicted metal-dependent peptidase
MTDVAADRLAAARTRLILDRPFLGALALRLPLVAAGGWCRTAASDARRIYYNPAWIAGLSVGQVQFVLAHEALHCALGHFARRGHRVKRRWDLACDLAVNPLLVSEGLPPPAEAVVLDLYPGMAAEEIYPCLADHPDEETLDEHLWGAEGDGEGGGRGAGIRAEQPVLTAREREHLAEQWRHHLAAAAQRARQAGKLAGALARLTESALASRVCWRALLARYLSKLGCEDFSYTRPHRRGQGDGGAIRPSLYSRVGELVVALDTSGSVSDEELAGFVGELDAIKGALSVRITLLACDAALAAGAPWRVEPWQAMRLPDGLSGGGGTDFRPVFHWVAEERERPDALIYFTDADGTFPSAEPDYPVFWVVKGSRPVPWGRRLQLD